MVFVRNSLRPGPTLLKLRLSGPKTPDDIVSSGALALILSTISWGNPFLLSFRSSKSPRFQDLHANSIASFGFVSKARD